MILIIQHTPIEGPGTIEDYFRKERHALKIVDLSKGDRLPSDLSDLEGVVSMGGPMNVYEEDKYPFLKDEDVFLKQVIQEEIPFLGICLGSQLLAKAAGAKVKRADKGEVGWYKVELTSQGKEDPLFQGLPKKFDVFQWHGDTFEIPQGGKHLVYSVDCHHQALKVGSCAYGLQFHVEVTEEIIRDWVDKDFTDTKGRLKKEGQKILNQYPKIKDRFHSQAEILYENFEKMIIARKVTV